MFNKIMYFAWSDN